MLTSLVTTYGWRRILYTVSVLGITIFVIIIVRLNKRRPTRPSGQIQRDTANTGASNNDASQSQQRRGGVKRITCSSKEVLLGLGTTIEFLPTARDAFVELCRSYDMYLVTTVSDKKQVDQVREFLEQSGLHDEGLDRRKVLFCETNKGRESFARQIEPSIHIDGDPVIVQALKPHLKESWLVLSSCTARTTAGNVTTAPTLHKCFQSD